MGVLEKEMATHSSVLAWELGASMVAQMVKSPQALLETQVQSLGQEDPLEKRIATHSSILAWRSPWTESPGGLQSMRSQIDTAEQLTLSPVSQDASLSSSLE